ncbi:MAG: phytoene/squalene synthase family protein [Bacteroidota bacterium]|nr:phytoene/squalene synthase family protein [Bacteroidota bacterium]
MSDVIFYSGVCSKISELITYRYSTSFSLGIRMFPKKSRSPICAIYGFVRLADEIVDSFYGHDKEKLLLDFRKQTFEAIDLKISTNPIIQSFQEIVNRYNMDLNLIHSFLDSMSMDLYLREYDNEQFIKYIYGSAEVIGLMCLCIFVERDKETYLKLSPYARALGAAYQKVNFLRDIQGDYFDRGRVYFPGLNIRQFEDNYRAKIEADIENDFIEAKKGIRLLPLNIAFGIYVSYLFYWSLFLKIKSIEARQIFERRIRISNIRKMGILCKAYIKFHLNMQI